MDQKITIHVPKMYRTWWGVILLIAFLPFFLFYWIWKKEDWSRQTKIVASFVLCVLLLAIFSHKPQSNQQEKNVPIQYPTETPQETPTKPVTKEYDHSKGNNYFASSVAQKLFDITEKASPGFIEDLRIDTAPEAPNNISDVTSAYLAVQVNTNGWNTMDDGSKKDLIVALMNSVKKEFPESFPHVTITNGIREVGQGELSLFGDPKITLE